MLNPFYGYTDSRNIRTGNPSLTPEFTNAFEGGYLFKNKNSSFYAGSYYKDTKDVIHGMNDVDSSSEITYRRPINFARQQSIGLESNISADLFKWWRISGDVNVYNYHTWGDYKDEELDVRSNSWESRLSSKLKLPKEIDFQSVFSYRGRRETAQGYVKPFYMLDIAISKDIFKGNGTLTLNSRDVLNTRKFTYIIDEPEMYSENKRWWRSRSTILSLIYRLNQKKKINKGGDRNMGGDMDY